MRFIYAILIGQHGILYVIQLSDLHSFPFTHNEHTLSTYLWLVANTLQLLLHEE